jgi:preprotein translocase subunit SecD
MLANQRDDRDAIEAMMAWFAEIPQLPEAERQARQEELEKRAKGGQPPPGPELKGNRSFAWSTGNGNGWATYSWIELGREARVEDEMVAGPEVSEPRRQAAEARAKNLPVVVADSLLLFYSRPCVNGDLPPEERQRKEYEYFYLARDPPPEKVILGKSLQSARPGFDQVPVIDLAFDSPTGDLIFELTSTNLPDRHRFRRHLAVILDGSILTAPAIFSPVRSEVRLSGGRNWSETQADALARILRSGALPVKLKATPVEERVVPASGGS